MKSLYLALFSSISICISLPVAAAPLWSTPAYQCTLSDQRQVYDMSNDGKNVFMSSTPEIFLICQSDTVVRGDSLRAAWIADNTKKPGWDNFLIAERKSVVRKNLTSLDMFRTVFSIKKPQCGWPRGQYHVRVYVNDSEGYKYTYTIR